MSLFELTTDEAAIFLGNLLGDGHIQKRGLSFRTKIAHGLNQKDYLFWKYDQLKGLCTRNQSPKLVVKTTRATKNGLILQREDQSYEFYLNSGNYLEKFHTLFYKPYIWKPGLSSQKPLCWATPNQSIEELKKGEKMKYKKVITEDLINYLVKSLGENPLLLAVWFLDDGSCRKDVFSGRLATQGFSKTELLLLQDYLLQTFDIRVQIVLHSRLKQQYYLSIPAKNNQFEKFVARIRPFVEQIPSLSYKIKDPRND